MTLEQRTLLMQTLIAAEDLRLRPYRCSAGKLTIGVGRNLEDRGIRRSEALLLLDNDIDEALLECRAFLRVNGFEAFDPVRQRVLVEMMFNLGWPRLKGFTKMRTALTHRNYASAAREMLDSKWARDVGARATRLADMMRSGLDIG